MNTHPDIPEGSEGEESSMLGQIRARCLMYLAVTWRGPADVPSDGEERRPTLTLSHRA
jgi:hypothetical protein